MPYRCVAVNCRNVVDLSKCIFVHNLFLWRLNNHFMKVQQAKWELIQATVSQEYALMETVFIDLVITSHISLELANTV